MAVMMPAPPEPGIPKAIMHENRNCSEKVKQSHKTKIFNLAKEDEEEEHEVEAGVIAEGLVGRSEPAEKWEGNEECPVDETEPEHGALVHAGEEEADAAKKICDHEQGVEQPEVVEPLHHLLELHRDVHVDVLVEKDIWIKRSKLANVYRTW